MFKQSVLFNQWYVGTVGMCQDYVQRGYGILGGASTGGVSAWDSWMNYCKLKHENYLFPQNVVIPIFFSGTWNGNYYGHVAALDTSTGNVYTSPYFKQSGHEVYSSIAELIATFKGAMPDISFVGWSEDIAGVQVITKEDIVKPSESEIIDTFETYLLKRPVNREQINYYLAQDVRILYRDVLGATKPEAAEVNKAFKDLLPGTSDPNRIPYYTSRSSKQLYSDIAGALRKQFDAKPSEYAKVNKELYERK